MKIARRTFAIFLASMASLILVVALVVRVAYSTVLDTDTYVRTMTEIGQVESMQLEVAGDITDAIVKSANIDSPQIARLFRLAGFNGDSPRNDIVFFIGDSVLEFLKSDQFKTLWADTNRQAHATLMNLVSSDETVAKDFVVDIGPLVTAAAKSIQDPNNKISKVMPLSKLVPASGEFQFKLIQANGVKDFRTAVGIAKTARTSFLLGSLSLLVLAWLVFGRTRGAYRLVGIALASGGALALVLRGVGKSVVNGVVGDEAKPSADVIYSITTSPLTGYAVTSIVIGAAIIVGATFYQRNTSV